MIEGKISTLNMTMILFPIILIVSLMLKLGMLVLSDEKNNTLLHIINQI